MPPRRSRARGRRTRPGTPATRRASSRGRPARHRDRAPGPRPGSPRGPAARATREIRLCGSDRARRVPPATGAAPGPDRRRVSPPGCAPRCRPPSSALRSRSSITPPCYGKVLAGIIPSLSRAPCRAWSVSLHGESAQASQWPPRTSCSHAWLPPARLAARPSARRSCRPDRSGRYRSRPSPGSRPSASAGGSAAPRDPLPRRHA